MILTSKAHSPDKLIYRSVGVTDQLKSQLAGVGHKGAWE